MSDSNDRPEPTAEQIAQARQSALNATHPASWVWSEETISYIAPVPLPTDGYPYLWDENVVNWSPFPNYPKG